MEGLYVDIVQTVAYHIESLSTQMSGQALLSND